MTPHRILSAMLICTALHSPTWAQNIEVKTAAAAQKQPLLDTLKEFVAIESGSLDIEGITKATELMGEKLRALGGQVEFIEADEATTYRMGDTPEKVGRMVKATFKGTGKKRILLIAHMDTVYPRGTLAKQSFRVDGNRAYGVGIADDKQGIAVILHAVAVLKAVNFKEYGTLTVLVNSDEELSSPASRVQLIKAGGESDAVLSFEASREASDKVSLATSGIAAAYLHVEGRASHSGIAPERGVNALYELSHQLLQLRDLSVPQVGLKLNWTVSQAGVATNRNVIPAHAKATADVRVTRVADYEGIEATLRERIKLQLLPDAKVSLVFERRRPPLEATDASRKMAKHAQTIYEELGMSLVVDDQPEGGGTDAAFAALQTKAPVIERLGLRGFGAHSSNDEYVLVDSIEPRLYLVARVIMDVSRGKGF